MSFIASNSAQSVGQRIDAPRKSSLVSSPLIRLNPWDPFFVFAGAIVSVSSPLIRLNPWDFAKKLWASHAYRFIASNSAQSVGQNWLKFSISTRRFIASNSAQSVGRIVTWK